MHASALVTAPLLALALVAVPSAPAGARQTLERFNALAANISNVGAAGIVPLDIRIDRWTPDEEHERLLSVLRDKGQEAFLQVLTRADRVGSIATPTSLRYDFFYARETVGKEGGRHIMMISDRPMLLSERMNAAPSRDYPFTVIEMRLDKDGNGTGTLSQLVQLRLLGNIMGIENLASAPIQLNQIRKEK